MRPFTGQEKGCELYPEVSREQWKVFEQRRVVVKAELGRLTLEMIDCCVDTVCKETTERRRAELGGENGADLRETMEEWAGPDTA